VKFVAAVSVNPGDLQKLISLWGEVDSTLSVFSHVLISPLFASPKTLDIVRSLKASHGIEVYFDSGGYYVQQGRLTYEQLYGRLLNFYLNNQWADWYVLPDHVPTSVDNSVVVEHKVRDTITVSRLFFQELPAKLKERAIPVVQGHTPDQVQRCLESYVQIGSQYIGFGSFGTAGVNSSINQLTARSLENLSWLSTLVDQHDVRLHLFGMTSPPVVWVFGQLGAYSFDSLGWNKAANYGNVYLPFIKAHNISYKDPDQALFSEEQFTTLKAKTEHNCPFCQDFRLLATNYHYRRAHNLAVLMETAERIQTDRAAAIVEQHAPKYLQRLMRRNIWVSRRHFMSE
jgi:queuine/archaeosine tRNA-ribosyltransferase